MLPGPGLRDEPGFAHFFREIEPGGPSRVFVEEFRQLPVKFRVIFIIVVGFLQLNHRVHQGFGNILPAVNAEAPLWICHNRSSFLTAAAKAAIFSASLYPSVSMPELTSTP